LKKVSVCLLFAVILGNHLNGQVRRLLPDQQRLYLVLASTYYWVARDSDIDLDSCLIYICKLNNLDRQLIIQENMPVYNEQSDYIDPGEQVISLKKQLSESTGQNRITLLNALGTYYCFQPGIKSNNLDSAFYYLTKANKEAASKFYSSFRIQNLLGFGKYYYKRNNIISGDSCFQMAVALSNREGNSSEEALSWERWALNKPLMVMTPLDRLSYYEKALAIYRKLKDTINQISCLTQASYIQFFTRQENLSIQSSEEALSLERKIHFPYTHYNTDMLALGYAVMGKHAQFMNYANLSASTMESTRDSANAGFFYKRIADMYLDIVGAGDESAKWDMKALDAFQRVDYREAAVRMLVTLMTNTTDPAKYRSYIDLSNNYLKSGQPLSSGQKENLELVLGYCYHHLNEPVLAEIHFNNAEKLHIRNASTWQGSYNGYPNFLIANYCIQTKQFARAEKILQPVLKSEISQNLENGSAIYVEHMLFSIDSAKGDLKNALTHLSNFQREHDSVDDQQTSKRLEELKIRYETEKKDKDLQLLSDKNQLQIVSINKERQIRNIIIATSLVFLALFYTGYRLKQRTNNKLQKQQLEINRQNSQLQILLAEQKKLVEEKEWLVKEIHHRVKNNLQIIISLLNAQSEFLESPTALHAIQESKERMQAIALIHQKLYQPDHGTLIDMASYIQDMTYNLQSSFTQANRIHFSLHAEPIELDVSQAVPLGLILNEAITNAIKYAFPKPATGTVTVYLQRKADSDILLRISDNGVGFPVGFEINEQASLGIQLIKLFSEQLEGELSFQSGKGVEISILFKQVTPATEFAVDSNKQVKDGKDFGS
jgi:two-component system, sensor histidine kinase PdtaS